MTAAALRALMTEADAARTLVASGDDAAATCGAHVQRRLAHTRAVLEAARADWRHRYGQPDAESAREYAGFYRARRDAWRDAYATTERTAAADDAAAREVRRAWPGQAVSVEVGR